MTKNLLEMGIIRLGLKNKDFIKLFKVKQQEDQNLDKSIQTTNENKEKEKDKLKKIVKKIIKQM